MPRHVPDQVAAMSSPLAIMTFTLRVFTRSPS
jgi:hypothetical protein